MPISRTLRRVHFIGIGGAGVSGIALVAARRGIQVSGSDLKESRYTRELKRAGIEAQVGHDAANVADPAIEVVVVSTAIPESNPELRAARERGLEVWPRARMLAYLGRDLKTIAIAGTHGKTTTSSMLATSLMRLGSDASFLIGGVVAGYGSNAHAGSNGYYVVEADESDGSFTELDPLLELITNIDYDHADHYSDIDEVAASFTAFMDKLRPGGSIIACADSDALMQIVRSGTHDFVTYGLSADADVRCQPQTASSFTVRFPDGEEQALTLGAVPGVHTMVNATGCMAALDLLGFDRRQAAQAVSAFDGVARRFDRVGEAGGVLVVDDYAHHPVEIAATLAAARTQDFKRVHVLFQPHRYTRTEALIDEFAGAFEDADSVTVMDVYAAGETPIAGVNAQLIVEAVRQHSPAVDIRHIHGRSALAAAMADIAAPGDLLMTMGAGDVTQIAPQIVRELELRFSEDKGGTDERL